LGGKDIARRPAHGRAEFNECLDEHGGFDRHVQRAGNAHTVERSLRTVFGAHGHEAGHLVLGDTDFATAEVGEFDVSDAVVLFGCTVAAFDGETVLGSFGEFHGSHNVFR